MLEKLKVTLDGKKTYITAIVGAVVALVGYLFGPIDLGQIHVPHVELNDLVKLIWEVLLAVFIRKGIPSANTPA